MLKKLSDLLLKHNTYTFRNKILQSILDGRGNISKEFPSDFSESEITLIKSVQSYSMTSPERLVSLSRAVDYVEKKSIPGAIVECGVWRGGSMMLIASRLISLNNTHRNLFMFDTFEGMSSPSSLDVDNINKVHASVLMDSSDKSKGNNVWAYSSLQEVKTNLSKTGYPDHKLHFIKGKVEETISKGMISQVALLRLDTDWYESTLHELETLYDSVVPGGIVIFDDYGHWKGAQQAVDDFFSKRKMSVFLNRIDYTARLIVK